MRNLLFAFILGIFACSNASNHYSKANDAIDAGRMFIDACLKGEFDKADFYMLKESQNEDLLKKLAGAYAHKSSTDKKNYSESSIIINDINYISQKEVIINYKNSFDKFSRKVKVIFDGKDWLIDFKYTLDGNL